MDSWRETGREIPMCTTQQGTSISCFSPLFIFNKLGSKSWPQMTRELREGKIETWCGGFLSLTRISGSEKDLRINTDLLWFSNVCLAVIDNCIFKCLQLSGSALDWRVSEFLLPNPPPLWLRIICDNTGHIQDEKASLLDISRQWSWSEAFYGTSKGLHHKIHHLWS